MRIAYLCTDFGIPIYGSKGASVHVRELCRALHALGHEVAIYSPRPGGEAPADFAVPVRHVALESPERAVYELLADDPTGGEVVAKEVRAALYAASLRHRLLDQLRDFRPDAIYERYALFGTAGLAVARELRAPLVLEVNAPLSDEQAAHRGLALAATAHGLEQRVLRGADRLITVSRELASWLARAGVDPTRVLVLPNAVDAARFERAAGRRDELRARLGLAGRPVVGFLGTLKAWHGTEALLRAVARLHQDGPAPNLLIVGDGPELPALAALAEREGIAAATTFTGAVPHEEVPTYLAAMDLAVAPYPPLERFYFSPLKLFEYMAAGLPVVAAGIGQLRDCVRHGVTGWLYPPGDVEALAGAIAALLADPARAAALGQAGREYVRERHTWEGNARAVVELVRSLPLPARGVRRNG